jgi:hypothetical protein
MCNRLERVKLNTTWTYSKLCIVLVTTILGPIFSKKSSKACLLLSKWPVCYQHCIANVKNQHTTIIEASLENFGIHFRVVGVRIPKLEEKQLSKLVSKQNRENWFKKTVLAMYL